MFHSNSGSQSVALESTPVEIDGLSLDMAKVVAVARYHAPVILSDQAREAVRRCAGMMEHLVTSKEVVYGLTTGIGDLVKVRLSSDESAQLQRNIILSHSAGTGAPLPLEVVRAAMLLRANLLARGFSGVREVVIDTLIRMLNEDIVPEVPEKGSLGASGDLSPLAQIAEVMLGSGYAYHKNIRLPAGVALQRAGITPIVLAHREGLALINGPQVILAGALLLLNDSISLLKHSIVAAAMTMDALGSSRQALDPRLHGLRPFAGQVLVASNVRKLLNGSEIPERENAVQDGYSLRCIPQVLGTSVEAIHYALSQCSTELNSVTDNPVFFPEDGAFLSGGNFHGQPIAMAMDFAAIALAEVANLAERHVNRMLNARLSGLPPFLAANGGVNSGLMLAQYTAAALVSENKVLAHPGVVDSISVSADQEDHVSMGPVSVRKCAEILENCITVLGIELLCAAQALDFRRPRTPGVGTGTARTVIRGKVPFMEVDRPLYVDIASMRELVETGSVLTAVEEAVGDISICPVTVQSQLHSC
jgi:histidine ammonia-lyase